MALVKAPDHEDEPEMVSKIKINATLKRLTRDVEDLAEITITTDMNFEQMQKRLLQEFDFVGQVNMT